MTIRSLLPCLLALTVLPVAALTLEVKPGGPTFEQTRDAIRQLKAAGGLPPGGVTVNVAPGSYELARPFELSGADTGTPEAPLVWRAAGAVTLIGGKLVKGWAPVTDAAVLERLPAAARGKVLVADLKALGVTDFGLPSGGFAQGGGPGLEVFYRDTPMTLARYPNEGFIKITGVEGPTPVDVRGTKGCVEGIFTCDTDADHLTRWAAEPGAQCLGYWFWDWAEGRQPIKSIDAAAKRVTLSGRPHSFGYRRGQWFYVYNALCELDQPGEWYLDRETGKLYLWAPGDLADGDVIVSVLPSLVKLSSASYVTLRGFTLTGCRGTAVTFDNCRASALVGCTIRNVGSSAVSVNGGESCRVAGCDIEGTGDGGVSLSGGDRRTLTHGNHVVENCHIHHYSRWNRMYRPAVTLAGCGNIARHNLIHNAPHMAVGWSGNEQVMEFNEIHSVCYESNDAGAMYAGRDWTMRGNIIRGNYLHHIYGHEGRGCVGVYLDDQYSNALISGNLFVQVPNATFIGGGRDTTVDNNIFVDCNPAFHLDARGLGWAAPGRQDMVNKLKAMPTTTPPWSERWPQLLTLLDDNPMAPKNDVLSHNLCVGGRFLDVEGKAKPGLLIGDNLVGETGLVDPAHGDYRLVPDGPAVKLGFQPLALDQVGLRHNDERASWPVVHSVRPAPVRPADPPKPPKRAGAGRAVATKVTQAHWAARTPAQAVVLEQGIGGESVKPRSQAWVAHDGTSLLVAFDNEVDPRVPLRPGATWGQDDAVEVALKVGAGPILVLRGYPNGQSEASDEAGASADVVKRLGAALTYTAKIVDKTRWTCELRVPLAALGLAATTPAPPVAFNLSVRKTAGDQWLMWVGTHGHTWDVEAAGKLTLGG